MEKILSFFADFCYQIWQSLIAFKVPIFNADVPFAYVIGSFVVFSMFAKIVIGLFDLDNAMDDYFIHEDSVYLAKERIAQRNAVKEFNNKIKKNGHISAKNFRNNFKGAKIVNSKRGYTDNRSFYDVKKNGGK